MTAPADSSVATKYSSIDHIFFFLHVFPFIVDSCNFWSLLKKFIKMKGKNYVAQ